jgi:diguanylate cyclase (GGDEF)-like protein
MKLALSILLLIGAQLIFLSIIPSVKICRTDNRFGWRALLVLTILFLFAYVSFLFLLIYKVSIEKTDIIVTFILLGGGGFVFLVIRLALASITQAHELAKKEKYKGLHDPLTGLPNRKYLSININETIELSKKTNNTFAVLIIDLDRFKEINDTLGHDIGDRVLVEISNRFNKVISKGHVIARLGGDEFALLIPGANSTQAMSVCKALHESLAILISVDHYQLTVDMSIGIAIYPEHGTDMRTLLKNSDVAMYQSKKDWMGSVIYDESLNRDPLRRLELVSGMKKALINHEFELYYQPIVDAKSFEVEAVEALIRWPKSCTGPDVFIPLAEEANIIQEITIWVLNEALEQAKKWSNDYPNLKLNINISSLDLRGINFSNKVGELLDSFAVPANMLVFEITESAMVLDIEGVKKVMNELNELKINFAIDDFGTGFSSLSLLRELPTSTIKIDQSFIKNMKSNTDNSAIVKATIDLAHNIGQKAVAEGVDNEKVAALLLDMGCDYLQGYSISRPLNRDETEFWLAQHYFGIT